MKRTFNVAADLMPEFSELISDNELANELMGRTEDDEIIVEVNYRSNQKGEILELVDWLEENNYPTEEVETDTEEN